jgi:hypothetical protein
MRKLLAIVLVLAIACIAFSNIVEFFEGIPPVVRFVVGGAIAIYGLSWAYTWLFDPIVVVTDTKYGAYNFGPFIVVDSYLWYDASESSRNLVLNHEYVHYVQHALYGPILSLTYPVCYWYSTLKSGDQWTSNPWEQEAFAIQTIQKPDWQPSLVIELE